VDLVQGTLGLQVHAAAPPTSCDLPLPSRTWWEYCCSEGAPEWSSASTVWIPFCINTVYMLRASVRSQADDGTTPSDYCDR
jgi:hypothetical protein